MRILIFLVIITVSSATFHKVKPKKLYKHLVEPFVDVALKGIFTGGIIEPVSHFVSGSGGKHSKHHPTHKHYRQPFYPYHNDQHHHSSYHHDSPHHHHHSPYHHHHHHSPYHHHHSPYHHHHHHSPYHHHHEGHHGEQLFYPAHSGHHHCHHQSEPHHGHYGGALYAIGGEGLHHGEFEYDDDVEHYLEHH